MKPITLRAALMSIVAVATFALGTVPASAHVSFAQVDAMYLGMSDDEAIGVRIEAERTCEPGETLTFGVTVQQKTPGFTGRGVETLPCVGYGANEDLYDVYFDTISGQWRCATRTLHVVKVTPMLSGAQHGATFKNVYVTRGYHCQS